MRLTLLLAAALSMVGAMTGMPAFAADERVYEGTAGNVRVVIAIDDSGEAVDGRYFYDSTRRSVDLAGQRQGGTLTLASDMTGDKITMTVSGVDLTGMLVTAKGRSLPISLHPATLPGILPADIPPDLGLYEKLQLSGLKLVPQQAATVDGKAIRWYREGRSGLRLFRVESGYAPAAMAAVNHLLARQQWSSVSDSLGCTDIDGQPGIEVSEAGSLWLGAHVMSYRWNSSWFCAHAAHPDFGTDGHSFDMVTGRALTLEDIVYFGARRPPAEDSDAWSTYRDRVFARSVVALLRRYHPREMAPPKAADDECDYTDAEVWKFPSWALTAKGLWVGAIFARVERACDGPDWAIIPWSRLSRKP